ncbi:hypothetical protein COCSADRAFT_354079 [Bipolaris sorokiniana ND90Pr]|uniref:Uncharacterized protein n=1 Tax=Cochliobolus sativus (strain ND90Pr / ATCC 201652) TaxID=665912 RepID=M2TDC1_COCSN|nr:uncharacterized protein COCSADRAFT_354079 [Bipolaris sorokiniana ND90Pr]EMD66747.1 hypothetical protein COCSADRAFT_354079 [Bipolaris sorokiniana ND90Pr]
MCKGCINLNIAEPSQLPQLCQQSLEKLIEHGKKLLKYCTEMEDYYRSMGYYYHTSQLTKREAMAECPTHGDHLVKLEDAFNLDHPEDYHILFKPMETSITQIKEVVSDAEHISSNISVSDLAKILTTELQPKLHTGHITINKMRTYFSRLNLYTNTLRAVSCEPDGTHPPNNNRETPWHRRKFNVCTGKWELESMAEEWTDFLNWVTCLPETQAWVQKGEDVKEIALRWLKNFVVVELRLEDIN